jgi:DNA-binding response OmpR family regulator
MTLPSILCVEPDSEARALFKELLSGFQPSFARNAYDALRELSNGAFDAYVLELWLPDFSGLALCREIHRTDPRGPVVFCTAAARVQDEGRAMKAGAHAYLRKPLDPPQLLESLRVLIASSQARSARASEAAERAVVLEIERYRAEILKRTPAGREEAFHALQKLMKPRIYLAYAQLGGVRASFDRGWTAMYRRAWSSFEELSGVAASAAEQPS